MQCTTINGIKVYDLSKGLKYMENSGPRKKEKMRVKLEKKSNYVELIKDFAMPDVVTKIAVTPDEKYIFLLGGYKPVVKCYELEQLSLKFERYAEEDLTKIQFLEKDYTKFVMLEGNRILTTHAKGGIYDQTAAHENVTDIIYSSYSRKLLISDSAGGISIKNYENGNFYQNIFTSTNSSRLNCLAYNSTTDCFVSGSADGVVDFWNVRASDKLYSINLSAGSDITAVAFRDHLRIGVGTSNGIVHIYDIRKWNVPFSTRDLNYPLPVRNIAFHQQKVVAAVGSVFKIWEPAEGVEGNVSLCYDTNAKINDFFHFPRSGLLFAGCDQKVVNTYFIPQFGDAPDWCQQLGNFIIDTEAEAQSLYDTHTFVTREEIDELHLSHLVGTDSLRAFMHGYHLNSETYRRAKRALEIQKQSVTTAHLNKIRDSSHMLVNKEYDVPDPSMNVPLKSLMDDERFSVFFNNHLFQDDPNCNESLRVLEEAKRRERKLMAKQLKTDKAKRSIQMAQLHSEEI